MRASGFGLRASSRLLMGLLALATAAGCRAQPADSLATTEYALALGDSVVHVVVAERNAMRAGRPSGLHLLVLHDDENTAGEAGHAFVEAHGGRLVELRAQDERYVAFALDGRAFSVDPNRIFTDVGVHRTLGADSAHAGAVALARLFGDTLVAVYRPEAVVVTLHNNTPDRYSALSYAPGGEYARDAEAVHLEDGADPDDFFFVTDRAHYETLAAEGFNVVLQDNARVTDDGSLSVWAAREGVPYVNVEAEHGHLEEQVRMLEALARVLAAEAP
jgi:hypothetical protein